jgi:hypothetical protein
MNELHNPRILNGRLPRNEEADFENERMTPA